METFFSFLVKLSVIFIGSGLCSLLAYHVGKEARSLPQVIINLRRKLAERKEVAIIKSDKVSLESGVHEIFLSNMKLMKIFSSHKGMKII